MGCCSGLKAGAGSGGVVLRVVGVCRISGVNIELLFESEMCH